MPEIRERNLRRMLDLFKAELSEASSKLENSFCELMQDIDEYPEIEQLAMSAQSLYGGTQDLMAEVAKFQKNMVKT